MIQWNRPTGQKTEWLPKPIGLSPKTGQPSTTGFAAQADERLTPTQSGKFGMTGKSARDTVHFGSRDRHGGFPGLQAIINESLIREAGSGNLSAVRNMLTKNVDVNFANRHTTKTALMEAAENGKVEVMKLLVRRRANLNKVDYDQRTALMLAARSNAVESMDYLISAGAKTFLTDRQGMNVLLIAINCNRKEATKCLLDKKWNIETSDFLGRTPLFLAAERGNAEIVKELIARKANLESHNFEGMTALAIAAREGRTPVVQALIEAGANVNARNRFGVTPLMLAAREGNTDIVNRLLEKGADVTLVSNDQDTALSMAVGGNHAGIIRTLMEHGADVGHANNQGGTPLMEASRLGHLETALTLLEKPYAVNINHADRHGLTALGYAADRPHPEIVKELLKIPDIDIEARDNAGNTPLLLAARKGATQTAKILIDHNADINAHNRRDSTALHLASLRGKDGLVKLLLEYQVPVSQEDQDGATPLFLAAQGGHSRVMDLLIQAEGNDQRPYTQSFQQLQNYANTIAHTVGLDRNKPYTELLPLLAKHDNFRIAELLYLAQGKTKEGLSWLAENQMEALVTSSKAMANETNPEVIAQEKEKRDQIWKNLAFFAKNKVNMERPVVYLARTMQDRAKEKQAILGKIKAKRAALASTGDQLESLSLDDSASDQPESD